MRLESLRVRGLGPFREEWSVDLADYPGAKLIALTGPNGAGKSTTLELWGPGAMYRSCPTRGSLTALATTRDAMLEARLVNGRRWTIRHLVDGVSGKSEAVVLDEDGNPATPDAKVRSFDAWSKAHLPPPEVFFSSVFAPQGAAGFLGLSKGDRKAVLLRVLGVEHLEQLAERARERERAVRTEIATLQARIGDENARSGDVLELELAVENARAAARRGDKAVEQARAALAAAEREEAAEAEQARARQAARQARADLAKRHGDAVARAVDLEGRVGNNRAVLGEAEAIRAAVARLADLQEEQQRSVAEVQRLEALLVSERRQRDHEHDEAKLCGKRAAEARARRDRIRARMPDRAAVEKAVEDLATLEKAASEARGGADHAEALLDELRASRVAGVSERLVELREGLDAIFHDAWESVEHVRTFAGEVKDNDDRAAEVAEALPDQLAAAEDAQRAAQDRAGVAERALADAQQLAARMVDVEAGEAEISEAGREASDAADAQQVHVRAAYETESRIAELLEQQADAGAKQHAASAAIADLSPIAKKADPLARAEARLAELEPQLEAVIAERDRLDAELRATPEPEAPPPSRAPGSAPLREELARSERAAREAHAAAGAAEGRVEQARAGSARVEQLTTELGAQQDELADWKRLGADLGRDGLQAALIDAAGPEISAIANDLLHAAFGPRFTIRLDTQRLGSDGRMLETFDVVVIDTENGREASAETYSGGERVILGEALSLSLVTVACRQAGIERPHIIRDEAGAALDPERSRQWVAMLRRCVELVGAEAAIIVSHSPEVQELCDARIEVGRG